MILAGNFFLLGVSLLIIGLVTPRLSPSRHYFFYILYFQFVVYLHIVPTFYLIFIDNEHAKLYLYLQFASILFFEIPFIFFYLRSIRELNSSREGWNKIILNYNRIIILSFYSTIFSILFLVLAIKHRILFLWYGEENMVETLTSLPGYVWVIYRSFNLSGIILAALLLVISYRATSRAMKKVSFFAFMITSGTWFAWAILNQRGSCIVGILMILGVMVYFGRVNLFRPLTIFLGLMALIYTYNVVLNIRWGMGVRHRLTYEMFSPFPKFRQYAEGGTRPLSLWWRLNGIELMAMITPEASRQGFAKGEAWAISAYVLFMQPISREAVEEYKRDASSLGKTYLLWRYTSIFEKDYCSCMLTDPYGNFWLFGFLLVALVLGKACAYCVKNVLRPGSALSVIMAIFILAQIIRFEREFVLMVLGSYRAVPGILPFLILNPFKVVHPQKRPHRLLAAIFRKEFPPAPASGS